MLLKTQMSVVWVALQMELVIDSVFVFADYMINTFAYGIELHNSAASDNTVCVLCGEEY